MEIVENDKFKQMFHGLSDEDEQLKSSPKGYEKDHPHIHLLRRKSFTARIKPDKEMLIEGDLASIVEEAYLTLQPLVRWLQKAISIDVEDAHQAY